MASSSSWFSSMRSYSKCLFNSLKLNLRSSSSSSSHSFGRSHLNAPPPAIDGFFHYRHRTSGSPFFSSWWSSSLLPLALAVSAGSVTLSTPSLCDAR
ncbi:hypothetical protein TorRG33x02_357870 [Trema orientale]|uniref:Uncharacterized protein n=1 Tax=Trema orientale TaxID=63057 RepID=A0A2P5A4E6_TREOI|nr:hypothetical protein TorRG33x02_357870 [Trema orientale]